MKHETKPMYFIAEISHMISMNADRTIFVANCTLNFHLLPVHKPTHRDRKNFIHGCSTLSSRCKHIEFIGKDELCKHK